MKLKLKQYLGLWRSLLIYHSNPFRRRRLIRFYRQFIQKGDLCFDIGSHVGNQLAAWTKLGAKVVALEPQPQMMNYLQKRYGEHPEVILRQNAAGASVCQTQMYISTRNPTVTSLSKSWINKVRQDPSFAKVDWDRQMTIDVTTLDQLIKEYGLPKLCKIDVEGYEPQVLRGLSYPIPLLSFEYIPANISLAKESLLEIQRIGHYRFNWSVGESYQLQSPTWLKFQEMQDLLFSRLKKGRSGDIYAALNPSS